MKQIRLTDVRLNGDFIEVTGTTDDGRLTDFSISMADFILLRLQLDQQANPPAEQPSPLGPQQLQVIRPEQLTVFQEPLSGDPVLKFGLGKLGDLALQIPKNGLPGMLQQLLPYVSPSAELPMKN